jgi:hypothetical protein
VKTKTTKKRKIELYFPTEEEKEALLKAAEEKGMSASRYLLACFQEVQTGFQRRPVSEKDIIKVQEEIQALKAENEALKKENEHLLKLVGKNNLEISLLRTRETPVRERPIKEGIYQLNMQLIKLFKAKREITAEDIINGLKLDLKDRGAVDNVWRDLESLVSHEQVEATMEGWRWLGN